MRRTSRSLFTGNRKGVEKIKMCEEVLGKIGQGYKAILKEKLVGIYIHGSLAFRCFNPQKSDIDFIVVVKKSLALEEKVLCIQCLLDLEELATAKGFEMSIVLEKHCLNFIYPTPFELHYSKVYRASAWQDIKAYCEAMQGTDKDLAAHFQVIRTVGYPIYGKAVCDVFSEVPEEYYLDSILGDIQNAKEDIVDNPVYTVLNLCRVWAYLKEGKILSKKDGALWVIGNTDKYRDFIGLVLENYLTNKTNNISPAVLYSFAEDMLERIYSYDRRTKK